MEHQFNEMMKNMKITPDEVQRMTKAFENPQFRELFEEYVKEIENPESKAKYEEDIRQMEKDRGIDAQFVHPHPGHCLQTRENGKAENAYINIGHNDLVDQAKCERDTEKKGWNWKLPHSMSPPREERENAKNVKVFDVIFHPDTYRMGERNQHFMSMLRETAIDEIARSFDIILDKNYEVLAEKKYFGRVEPCVIRSKAGEAVKESEIRQPRQDHSLRKDLEKFMQKRNAKSKSVIRGSRNPWEQKQQINEDGTIQPQYKIKQSKHLDLQDYIGSTKSSDKNNPDNLVVSIHLPELKVSKNIKLDVQDKAMTLRTIDEDPRYDLKIELPFTVDSKKGNAKYKKEAKLLEVTLPIVMEKITFAESINIPPELLPEIPENTPRAPSSQNRPVMSKKELECETERIRNQKRVNLLDLIPAHNITLPDFKASESERWCLFEINVGSATVDLATDCKITSDGFSMSPKFDVAKVNIGLAISLGKDGVLISESNKYASDGFFEIKLRKSKPGLLKHYEMGKTTHSLDVYRFDALISDRQVEGDRSLPMANEPAVWVPKKEYTDPKDRPVAKANKGSRKR